uniref:hypothetical protein n=1 Tax=Stenotrophomonas sp. SrG TaxID=3414430 RepID=UPI003CECD9A5
RVPKPSAVSLPTHEDQPSGTSTAANDRATAFLIDQARRIDTDVECVIVRGSGLWLMVEVPEQTFPALVAFLDK